MTIGAIAIKEADNVATALKDLKRDEPVSIGLEDARLSCTVVEDIPFGHKFALVDISKGGEIIKYGEVIGRATAAIQAGSHAHIQNIESLRGRGDLSS